MAANWRKQPRGGNEGEPAVPGEFVAPSIISGVELTESQYLKLSQLIYGLCGIHLGQEKRELLKARLAKRFRALGVGSVAEYMRFLERDQTGGELVCFLDCITTNKTDFFREAQHFDFLAQDVLPRLERLWPRGEPLRIWSAACSTGEEPYTLAMVLLDQRAAWASRGASILASDLSTRVLAQGRNGVYAADRVAELPREYLTRYFQRGLKQWDGYVRVRPEVRELVRFERINLMDPFPADTNYHLIFCRNVMIYFDKQTRERLVQKFRGCLPPGGFLFVGHSESLTGIEHRLKFVRPAIYRRED